MPIKLNLTLDDLEGDAVLNVARIASARGITKEEALVQVLAAPFEDNEFSMVVDSRASQIVEDLNRPFVEEACRIYKRQFGVEVEPEFLYTWVDEDLVKFSVKGTRANDLVFRRTPDGGMFFLGEFGLDTPWRPVVVPAPAPAGA